MFDAGCCRADRPAYRSHTRHLVGPEPIIVAADGTGDVTTIAAGVAQARDGDTVLVRPGTYREQVVIDKAIELRGEIARRT